MNNSNSLELEHVKEPPQGTKIHENGNNQTPSQQIQRQQLQFNQNASGQQDFQFRSYSSYNQNNNNNNNNNQNSAKSLLIQLKNPLYELLFQLERFRTSLEEMKFYAWLVVIVLIVLSIGTLGSSILQYLCIPLIISCVEYVYLIKMSTLGLAAVRTKDFSSVPQILLLLKKSNIAQLVSQLLVILVFGIGMGAVQGGTYDDKFEEWVDENKDSGRDSVKDWRHFYEGALGFLIFFSIIYNILFFLLKKKRFSEVFEYYHKKFVMNIHLEQGGDVQNRGNNQVPHNQANQQQQQQQQEINQVVIDE
ncbi:hypothetical protein PPERSA_05880 [Pseudocohnilembus persalinus]|uniref:Transmembrane protein n=1 Tax=Pseudocohnilembus persalinus TaxID=266149 RepID=A0A0V0R3Z6_PSEPJ|nr:hypothetical protein PPERSA_05880 [Pseudocohnilembus persalinus]|eukprot:KRX09211.1 hypothetical protein PPERSA_05880 [Pseudocohnilembus persalinus]